jgi:hypothetical protein
LPTKVEDVHEKAQQLGISDETFRRAKRTVKPTAEKIDGEWYWTDQGGQPSEAK